MKVQDFHQRMAKRVSRRLKGQWGDITDEEYEYASGEGPVYEGEEGGDTTASGIVKSFLESIGAEIVGDPVKGPGHFSCTFEGPNGSGQIKLRTR